MLPMRAHASLILGAALMLPSFVFAESAAVQVTTPPPIEHFVERDAFFDIKISPDGKHLAANMPVERGSALFTMDTETLARKGQFFAGRELEIADFWWSSNDRLLIAGALRTLGEKQPNPTGELFGVNVDGSRPTPLVGYRAGDGRLNSRVKQRDSERVWAFPIDLLPGAEREALVEIEPWSERTSLNASIERLDTRTGRRVKVAQSPVPRARFVTDAQGNLRFAEGLTSENKSELYHRAVGDGDWTLLNAQEQSDQLVAALGFDSDGGSAYLQVSRASGPDAIERLDIASGERTEVYRHEWRDPAGVIRTLDGGAILGVYVREPMRRMHFFEPEHPEARLRQSLAAAFDGYDVEVTSATADGRKAILFVHSDRNPGEYFIFDRDVQSARHIGSRGRQLVPEQMGRTRVVQIAARDGLLLEGLLTLPPSGAEKNLPLVVHPHGGPYNVQDIWGFDRSVQILATRGYAVLQVNFRGSAGFGGAFVSAGYKQWGRAMQDDLTDATRWAVEQGIAAAGRICLFGASYGGYASLMGVAKEPELYACAAGDVGVYDLQTWSRSTDFQRMSWGRNYLRDGLGTEGRRENSPTQLADRIKVPIFLAAGESDRRAPVEQTEQMEAALKKAGVPVQSLYFRGEGHGYYSTDNQLKFYTELLAFLERHIGGSAVRPAAPSSP